MLTIRFDQLGLAPGVPAAASVKAQAHDALAEQVGVIREERDTINRHAARSAINHLPTFTSTSVLTIDRYDAIGTQLAYFDCELWFIIFGRQ